MPPTPGRFPTTRWSVVLAAQQHETPAAREALETLCRTYWRPLHTYVQRHGYSTEEAEDLTQGFFTRLLEKRYLEEFERERGRFRSFLLAALKHYLANERDWAHAQKRGGSTPALPLDDVEPAHDLTPERIFERQWALALLNQVLTRLQEEYSGTGKREHFERLKPFLTGEEARLPYHRVAAELAMTEGAARVAVHRVRRRFRDLLREEIAQTVAGPDEIGGEIRYLMAVIGRL